MKGNKVSSRGRDNGRDEGKKGREEEGCDKGMARMGEVKKDGRERIR